MWANTNANYIAIKFRTPTFKKLHVQKSYESVSESYYRSELKSFSSFRNGPHLNLITYEQRWAKSQPIEIRSPIFNRIHNRIWFG